MRNEDVQRVVEVGENYVQLFRWYFYYYDHEVLNS